MSLGLGASVGKTGLVTPGIVTDGLVLKQNYDTVAVVPISDGSAVFNGTSDYISTGVKPIDTALGTYCFWLKADETGANKGLFNHGDQQIGGFHIQWNSKPLLYLKSNYYQYFDDVPQQDDGEWHYWSVVIDPNDIDECKVYVNAVELGKGSQSAVGGAATAYGNFEMGRSDAANEFEGSLSNFGIWTGELTQAQIKSIMYKNYAGLNGSETTNLVSWWSLGEETATDGTAGTGGVKDYHGTNHGTLA